MNAQTRREMAIKLFTNVMGYEPDSEALDAGDVWEVERIDQALREWWLEMARLCEPDSGAESAITVANDQQKGE